MACVVGVANAVPHADGASGGTFLSIALLALTTKQAILWKNLVWGCSACEVGAERARNPYDH